MYDSENGVYFKSIEIVNEKSKPSPKPATQPSKQPKEAPGKKFTEAAPTPIRKSADPRPPQRP